MLGIGNNVGARLADRLARPVQSVDRRPPAPRGPAWETSSLSMPKTNTGYTGGGSVTIPKSSTFMPGGVYSNGQRRRGSATPMQQHHGMGSSHNGHAPQSPYGLRPTPMNGFRMWTNAPSKPAPVIMNPVYSAPTIRQSIYSTPNQSFNPYGSAQMPQQTVGTGSMQVPKTAQPQVRRGSQPPLTPSASSRLDSQMPMPKVGRGSQPPMQEGETKPAGANNTRQQPRLVPDQKVDSFHRGDAWSNPSHNSSDRLERVKEVPTPRKREEEMRDVSNLLEKARNYGDKTANYQSFSPQSPIQGTVYGNGFSRRQIFQEIGYLC